jgi:hypothetical protein
MPDMTSTRIWFCASLLAPFQMRCMNTSCGLSPNPPHTNNGEPRPLTNNECTSICETGRIASKRRNCHRLLPGGHSVTNGRIKGTQTQWIRPQEEHEHEWRKLKTSSQEETDTNNVWEEVEKEDIQGDLSKRTDKGKSSHVSSAESPVTSHATADRNETTRGQVDPLVTHKYQCALDKSVRRKATFG